MACTEALSARASQSSRSRKEMPSLQLGPNTGILGLPPHPLDTCGHYRINENSSVPRGSLGRREDLRTGPSIATRAEATWHKPTSNKINLRPLANCGAGSTQGVGGTSVVMFSEYKMEAQGTMSSQGKSTHASCLLSCRLVSVL